jgi:hypothetical protein
MGTPCYVFIRNIQQVQSTPVDARVNFTIEIQVLMPAGAVVGGVVIFDADWGADMRQMCRDAIFQWMSNPDNGVPTDAETKGVIFPDMTGV